MKTRVYIDGFNLYYGSLKGTAYRWLDLAAFCDRLFPKNTIDKIHYFTAKISARSGDPHGPASQQAYLDALGSLPRVEIHYGKFQENVVSMVNVEHDPVTNRWRKDASGQAVFKLDGAGQPVRVWALKTEEKGSDVNLAAHLLRDVYQGHCTIPIVISNDSDLLTPIRLAKTDCGARIGLALPRPKGSNALKGLADFREHIRTHHLSRSQLPNPVQLADGTVIHKPPHW